MGSYRVVSLGSSGLRVVDPPTYWAAAFFLVVTLVALLSLLGILRSRARPDNQYIVLAGDLHHVRTIGAGWKMPLFSCTLALVAGFFTFAFLQPASLLLDRQTGTYMVERYFLGQNREVGPLQDVAYAALQTETGAQQFVLVLQNGRRLSLGGYTDKFGQSEAVAAVNNFLGVAGEPR